MRVNFHLKVRTGITFYKDGNSFTNVLYRLHVDYLCISAVGIMNNNGLRLNLFHQLKVYPNGSGFTKKILSKISAFLFI